MSHADDQTAMEKLSVVSQKESLPTRPGSSHVVSEKELKKFEHTDIHQILRSVPGVNIQEEDGFGLRPNIGLRGGHPHRSRKVTLMEDGVLIAPAPYSAPAAYYFPQMSKLESIEVFKGVPSTRFGPNSIGGAINMVTKSQEPGARVKTGGGSFGLQKYDLGLGVHSFGDFSLSANRVESTGFKELAAKGNTGFVRNNATFRWDKYIGAKDQNIVFKFNWSDETSNETYAGLTDDDFDHNPYQRYAGTQLDEMKWVHQQFFLSYAMTPYENLRWRTTLYRHNFKRSWNKLNGFGGTNPNNPSATIRDVISDPESVVNNYYYQVLNGQANSGVLDDNRDLLDMGNNQRQYYSQGAQLKFDYELPNTLASHLFQLNYRFHQDGISRFHESQFFEMNNGQMLLSGARSKETTLLNESKASAHTVALNYELGLETWTFNPVVRLESIDYEQTDLSTQSTLETDEEFIAPGLGLFYQAFDQVGFLGGVNKGYTPVGPGQLSTVNTEEATNYELGVRFTGRFGAELIGFYSDYENLLGTCTQSAGCPVNLVDQRFNGGEAKVMGAEFLGSGELKSGTHSFPLQWTMTYTQAEFANTFASNNLEWGIGVVNNGDPIPYIPEWQSNLQFGWSWKSYSLFYNFNYLGAMADQALPQGREMVDERIVMGLAAHYQMSPRIKFLLKVDNFTDEKYAVSRRPFGLRPGMPRTFFVGGEIGFF